jgi:hypothetical protein
VTAARFANRALLLTALLVGNGALNIVISSEAVRLARRHLAVVPTPAAALRMDVESLAIVVAIVVLWSLGSLRSWRSIVLTTTTVFVMSAVLPLAWR